MAEQQTYLFDNAWVEARRRLTLLEEALDPATFRRLDALGVGAGSRCLDVGAGGGSVARWLARRVGRDGTVVATDVDHRFLRALDEPNLEVRQHDVVADPLPEAAYDLVHTRLVLMHLPQRDAILPRLVAALRTGGWLLVEEQDEFAIPALTSGAYRQVWEAFIRAVQGGDVRTDWARELPALLAGTGLVDVAAEGDVAFFRGGAPYARLWSLTWEQVRGRIEAAGVTREEFERTQEVLADPRQWLAGPATVAAWGRRPAP